MVELIVANKSDITDIADAVREQTSETELMSIKEMSTKIRALSTGACGVGVQPDLDQNDSTAPDYIKK